MVATDSGTGRCLVFVHGLGSDSRAWTKVSCQLTAPFRVLTVDLPGISLLRLDENPPSLASQALFIDEAMADRGISEYSLVGHSYGGAVALTCAQAFPAHVSTVTLIAPGGFGPEINPALRLITSRTGGVLLRMAQSRRMRARVERTVERYREKGNDPESIEGLLDTYNRLSSREAQQHFRRSVISAMETRRTHAISSIQAPKLPIQIIWGRDDLVLPVWQSETAVRVLDPRCVHIIDDAGHTPQTSHATDVAQLVDEFVHSQLRADAPD